MISRPIWLFLILMALPSLAQNKFYLQVYQDGKASMELEEFQKAKEFFEIAAFGLLDHPDHLLSCRIRLVLIASKMGSEKDLKHLLIQIKSLRSKTGINHHQIEENLWVEYLILVGEKERALIPSPDDSIELRSFISEHPDRLDALKKYLSILLKDQRLLTEKTMVKNAIHRFPDDIFIAEMVLYMDLESNRKRSYLSSAKNLLELDPQNSLAHEVLGLESNKKKRRLEALEHFSHVSRSSLPQTDLVKTELDDWFKAQAAIEIEKEATAVQKALDIAEKEALELTKKNTTEKVVNLTESTVAFDKEKSSDPVTTPSEPSKPEEANSTPEQSVVIAPTQRELETRVKYNPTDTKTRFELVEHLLNKGNLRKTKKHLAVLGRINSKDPQYLATFAHYHYLKENFKQVTDGLYGLNNLNDKAKYYLGKSYLRQGDSTQAFMVLSSIKNKTDFPNLVEELTEMKRNLPPSFEFIKSFDSDWTTGALNQKKKQTIVLKLLDGKDVSNSAKYVGKYQSEYPNGDMSLYFEARILLLKERYLEASDVFHRLANSGFTGHEIYYFSGYAFYKSGKPFVTKYMLEKAKADGSEYLKEIEEILSSLP